MPGKVWLGKGILGDCPCSPGNMRTEEPFQTVAANGVGPSFPPDPRGCAAASLNTVMGTGHHPLKMENREQRTKERHRNEEN